MSQKPELRPQNLPPVFVKRKGTTIISAYLLFRQENKICLLLRQNTGYMDGSYGLISGGVEEGESATAGIIREAYEEGGLILTSSELSVAHIMHRKTEENTQWMDVFFACRSWGGKLENREPHKCEELAFFPIDKLPPNTIPYITSVIHAVARGEFYSEAGWV